MDDKNRKRGPLSLYAIVVALFAVAVVVLAVLLAAYQTCGFAGCPEIEQVQGFVPDEASVVVDRDDEEIGKLFRVNRQIVELDSLPEHVTQAFVAIEDQDFFHHGGVDWSRAVGALLRNVRSGSIEEGFSTITMQVARNVFPEQLPANQRTLNRKISEIKVARELESRYSKDEILALYLNQIYFGSGAWGIEAAAQEYFGKSASELELGEAALLAGLPQAPSELNPRSSMERAMKRRRTVLRRMVDEGYITQQQADEHRRRRARPGPQPTREPRPGRVLHGDRPAARRGAARRRGLYRGLYDSHDPRSGRAGRGRARAEPASSRPSNPVDSAISPTPRMVGPWLTAPTQPAAEGHPYLQGATIIMAAETGDILALVGGRDFDDSKFNRAIQARRQPGSAFKPFVYAAALQNGYPLTTILQDTSLHHRP